EKPLQKNCTIRLQKATFWEALDKICSEGGLSVALRPFEEHPVLVVGSHVRVGAVFFDSSSPYRICHGAFCVSATGFNYQLEETRSNGFQRGRRPTSTLKETLQLQFVLAAEPRLKILSMGEPLISRALDDQGQSLMPKEDAGNLMRRMMFS